MRTRRSKLFISCILFFAMLAPNFAVPGNAAMPEPDLRLDEKVQSAFTKGQDEYDVIAFFKKAETSNLERALTSTSGIKDREVLVHQYVGELRQTAATSQAKAVRLLESAKRQGKVKTYESAYIVNALHVIGTKEAILELAKDPNVETIRLNEKIQLIEPVQSEDIDPADPNITWNVDMLNSPGVWKDFEIDGTGTTVGIIDSGVEFAHPALKSKWRGYDAVNDEIVDPEKNWFEAIPAYFIEQSPIPADSSLSHGTHVAGIILGSEENGKNQIGVAPGAKYIAARTFDSTGNTDNFVLIRAGEWMLAPGGDVNARPDVVNASWASSAIIDDWYRDVVNAWRAAGIVPVFAAGNSTGQDPSVGPYSISNPANYPESFAVGAVDQNYRLGGFSKRGPSLYDQDKEIKAIKPEVTAPGVGIYSSIVGKGYAFKNGTSMAAPHVAGTVALLRQANPNLTVAEIEEIIESTARPLTDEDAPSSPNMSYGHGVVDTYAAVSKVLGNGSVKVEGHVVVEGEDNTQPTLTVDIAQGKFVHQLVPVTIYAKDENGVVDAKFEYLTAGETEWKTLPLTKVYGVYKDVRYEGTVPAADVAAGDMKFRWSVKDSTGNVTEGEDLRDIKPALVPKDGYTHDFETPVAGWLFTEDFKQDELSQWSMPGYIGARSGTKVIGTQPYQLWNLKKYTVSTAEMPPINLSDTTQIKPSVGYYLRYLPSKDFKMVVEGSTDYGKTWTELRNYTDQAQYWVYDQIDLSQFLGNANVQIRFRMEIGESTERGFFIDDIRLNVNENKKPLTPTDFEVSQEARGPKLTWNTPAEDNRSYKIYRGLSKDDMKLLHTFPAVKNLSIVNREYIDANAKTATRYFYKITAVDHFGNESDPTLPLSITNQSVQTLYYSDFEKDNGGLKPIAMGELNVVDWEWGESIHVAGNPTKMWATNFEKGVTGGAEYALELPEPLDIPEDGAFIKFKSLTDLYWNPDPTQWSGQNFVQVSEDNGNTWNNLIGPEEMMAWEKQNLWFEFSADLTAYAGKPVKIRFYTETVPHANGNPSYPEQGWYLDDVEVAPYSNTIEGASLAVDLQPDVTNLKDFKNVSLEEQKAEVKNLKPQAEQALLPENTIPLKGANVVIKETGLNTKSDDIGHFSLNLEASNRSYTMEVSKYGYHSQTKEITIKDGKPVALNFKMNMKQNGSVEGSVVNASGEGIADAYVRLLEDSNVAIVQTGADGTFTLPEVLEGTYTLRAIAAGHTIVEETVVVEPNKAANAKLTLEEIETSPEWIIYDNGKKSDTLAFAVPGKGFAVKFKSLGTGRLSKTSMYFVDDWLDMWGTEIKVGVLKENPETGAIYKVAEFESHIIKQGQFNDIDLTKLGVELEPNEVFYITTEQMYGGGNNPALGIDSFSPYSDNSFVWNGALEKLDGHEGYDTPGSLMIRAQIEYSDKITSSPSFVNLEPVSYTNKETMTVRGTTLEDGIVKVYVNDEMVKEIDVVAKAFSLPVSLKAGNNKVYATLTSESGSTSEPSMVHQIVLDQTAPTLKVSEPIHESTVNSLETLVKGTIADDNMDRVLVNGIKADLKDGKFQMETPLNPGVNEIVVDAFDLANNRTRKIIKVISTSPLPQLPVHNVRPEISVTLKGGESVKIHAESEAGAKATYTVSLPNEVAAIEGISLPEVEPGIYEAWWTAPMDMAAENMVVNIHFKKGQTENKVTAPGRINVINEELIKPNPAGEVTRVEGKNRFETAALFSVKTYDKADTVVLANGMSLADALFAGPLALAHEAPVLLTKTDELPAETLQELKRLGAKKVIVIGGTQVVSDKLYKELSNSFDVRRLGGRDRYDTSRLIANEVLEMEGSRSAFFVGPDRYADAVAAGANVKLADFYGIAPIIMVKEGRIPQFNMVARGFVLGGKESISESLYEAIYAKGYALERIEGTNRHDTAVKLAERFMGKRTEVLVANGHSAVDALVAGSYSAINSVPLLTVLEKSVPTETEAYIKSAKVKHIVLAGGKLVISDSVRNYLLLTIK